MALFRYKARNPSGELVVGEMEAADPAVVVAQLQRASLFPVAAEEVKLRSSIALARATPRRTVDLRALGVATKALATLLRSGMAVDRAIAVTAELAETKLARQLFEAVLERLRRGVSLSASFADAGFNLPRTYTSLIAAAEAAGGALHPTLFRLSEYVLDSHRLRQTIRSALLYPALLFAMTALSLFFMFTTVLPGFRPFFDSAEATLPWTTQMLFEISDLVSAYWRTSAVVFAVALLVMIRFIRSRGIQEKWHKTQLRLPLIGMLVKKREAARLSHTLATLTASSVTLVNALAIAKETAGNLVFAEALTRATVLVRQGRGLAEPLQSTGVFPDLMIRLIRVGEESGALQDMLSTVSRLYEEDLQRSIERLLGLLVPALTIVVGGMIAFVVASLLLAILSVNDLAIG